VKILHSQFTIAEVRDMLERGDLTVNKSYQRSPNIWPVDAQSYFIDTILEGYPFPKVYFYEQYDQKKKRPLREIVDGQQRISSSVSYLNNQFQLSAASKRFKGLTFDELTADDQQKLLMTHLQVDIILSAERSELLEMFRRMNAYTAPLNAAEKRHSGFQGKFKWFIAEMSDLYAPLLGQFEVFTPKQILRMSDAEFLTELALIVEKGIINKEQRSLSNIYKQFDEEFADERVYRERLSDFFETLKTSLNELQRTFIMKPYVLHSLFCAMTHRKYGICDGDRSTGIRREGIYFRDRLATISNLEKLAYAHETQEVNGPYSKYVEACLSTTHRIAQRTARTQFIASALS
jgi:hypothetical protein